MSKKILNTIVVLAGIGCATTAMAATSINTTTVIGAGTFTPSAKVGISAQSTATSYAATACHLSGTFEYGTVGGSATAKDASKIYHKDIPAQAADATVGAPTAVTSATDLPGTGWE